MSDFGKTTLYAALAVVAILAGAATGIEDPAAPCYPQCHHADARP